MFVKSHVTSKKNKTTKGIIRFIEHTLQIRCGSYAPWNKSFRFLFISYVHCPVHTVSLNVSVACQTDISVPVMDSTHAFEISDSSNFSTTLHFFTCGPRVHENMAHERLKEWIRKAALFFIFALHLLHLSFNFNGHRNASKKCKKYTPVPIFQTRTTADRKSHCIFLLQCSRFPN